MQTIIEVIFDWGDDVDPMDLGQEEIESALHETGISVVEENCAVTTRIKRWE